MARLKSKNKKDVASVSAKNDVAAANDEAAGTAEGKPAAKPGAVRAWLNRRNEIKQLNGKFETYPHLLALKPRERYIFRSDYFEVDGIFGCVLAMFHDEAAHDGFAPFWGIDRIPGEHGKLDREVTVVVLEQITRRDEKWVETYTKSGEKINNLSTREQNESGTTQSRRRAEKVSDDFKLVIDELTDGASYLNMQMRLLVKAPTLEMLEENIGKLERLYVDRFGTLKLAPYVGEQRQELSALLKPNEKKRGKGFGFTSRELAGSYSLVTNGLNDAGGEYVGYLVGDVNTSAVILDSNQYEHHVVIADGKKNEYLGDERVADMWCSKLSQAAMLENGRVVHLVLNGADLDKLGPKFSALTSRVDLNSGDVNMFEMFGEEKDELAIYAMQMEKLKLMFEQLFESPDGAVASIIRSALDKIATQFYIDEGMWAHDAQNNHSRLRVVNLPHKDVPLLKKFVAYLDTAYKSEKASSGGADSDDSRAYNVLRGIARTMLSTHGDLFNQHTADAIDGVHDSMRVIYDLSGLRRRGGGNGGEGVAMAQLVNIVGFAVAKLGKGDSLIIHGAEHIDGGVKDFLTSQFEHLWSRGGRVVYSYGKIDDLLKDMEFNNFHEADYTIFGQMNERNVKTYEEKLHQTIPPALISAITNRDEHFSYLRRGVSNVVFYMDLPLGLNPAHEQARRKRELESRREEASQAAIELDTHKVVPGARLTGSSPTVGASPAQRQEAARIERKAKRRRSASGKSESTMTKTTAGKGGN